MEQRAFRYRHDVHEIYPVVGFYSA